MWGGATAANQYEGAYMTDGKLPFVSICSCPMVCLATQIELYNLIQPMKVSISITIIKKILLNLEKWDLRYIGRA
ncbi:MAG: hypothetical protein V8S36_08245 [Lachnospiraceae bacterium]